MDVPPETVTDVTKAIQLSLAPVFLLSGIAGLLNVMSGRLARIVDRVRALTERPKDMARPQPHPELHRLERRRHLTRVAITACTIAALLLCITIATLFLEVMFHATLKWLIGGLFTAAMLALIASLSYFLREVHVAMQSGSVE
jgi:uncharacterized protein DUF2721